MVVGSRSNSWHPFDVITNKNYDVTFRHLNQYIVKEEFLRDLKLGGPIEDPWTKI